jgi:cold shock CspA family protein
MNTVQHKHLTTEEDESSVEVIKEDPRIMKGKVRSITPEYGFIVSEDGISHYFNARVLLVPEDYQKLTIGSPVEFEPKPSQKGMRAINVSVSETFFGWIVPDKFLTTYKDDSTFRPGEDWLMKVDMKSRWFKDPAEGRSELVYLTEQAGGNRVSNLEMHRESINWGSFRQTRHSWSCVAGIYGKRHDHETAQALEQHSTLLTQYTESVQRRLEETQQMLDKKRFEQRRVGAGTYFVIIVCLYLLAYLYLHH